MTQHDDLRQGFDAANDVMPLVAVLRGLRPDEAEAIGSTLAEVGFRLLEVPLNSPGPFASVAILRRTLPAEVMVGGGTVLSADHVAHLVEAGAQMIFSPHTDLDVIRATRQAGLVSVPGVATPSEAFAALKAGADALKLFPAGDLITPKVVKAIRVVLPAGTRLLPFGGITPENMKPYYDAGARSFGIGAALYKPGMSCSDLETRALEFVAAWHRIDELK